jgi:hypothetical protein
VNRSVFPSATGRSNDQPVELRLVQVGGPGIVALDGRTDVGGDPIELGAIGG